MPSKDKHLITLSNVSFRTRGKTILKDINLTINKGDFLGIIGPNGGGKTTLIKLILGIYRPSKGTVRVMGKAPTRGREAIGYLSQFENIDLEFPITVREVVLMSTLGGPIHFTTGEDIRKAQKALRRMDIEKLADRQLQDLSGGEKQRVFIARALATEPEILILDEPVANVDITTQDSFYALLKELNKTMTIVIVEHDVETLRKYTNQVACINKCIHEGLCYHEVQG